uniref:non-specific serine/threonine protein kinase n=1 Tax=Arcella intermedia TaxID=1963864 RepID=A0A6B2L0Z2_9EUKA
MDKKLGKGGLATVRVGIDFMNNHRVAVKIIDKTKLTQPREQIGIVREITIMKLLKHENILHLYDVYENKDNIFLILDLYEGGDLYSYVTSNGPLRNSEAVRLFRQLINGVEYCHRNLIVHRDLKPENLLLSADLKTLVLSDFGLSTGVAGHRAYLKTRCGTIHYISPEVARGDPYVGTAADIWSCGVILYAMVTACLPFEGDSLPVVLQKVVCGRYTIPQNLPEELKDLIQKMLCVDPTQRITAIQIKRHPWYCLGIEKSGEMTEDMLTEPSHFNLSREDIEQNRMIIENLKLLGWEEQELVQLLQSTEMNHPKIFYKLLKEHREMSHKQNKNRIISRSRSIANGMSSPPSPPPPCHGEGPLPPVPSQQSPPGAGYYPPSPRQGYPSIPEYHGPQDPSVRTKRIRPVRPVVRRSDLPGQSKKDHLLLQHKPVKRRAATEGDGRPEVGISNTGKYVVSGAWGVSPSRNPLSPIYTFESRRSLSQILHNLTECFNGLQLQLNNGTQNQNSIVFQGQDKQHQSLIKVQLIPTVEGSIVEFQRESDSIQEDFLVLVQQIEKNMLV